MKFWLAMLFAIAFTAAPVSAQSLFGGDEVFISAKNGDSVAVEKYLLEGNNPNARDGKKVPLLLHAAASDAIKTVLVLIKHGAQLDLTDTLGNTALLQAAAYGANEAAVILLEKGAKIDLENRQGETALIKAAQSGQLAVVETLLVGGANANISDFTGRTALDHATQNRHRDVAKRLEQGS